MEYRFEPRAKPVGVFVLNGRLDLLSAAYLKESLQKVVADGWTRLVIDLDGVPFVDSSGLGALIGGLKAARIAGGDLRIARPSEQPKYILQISTLDRVLVAHATLDDALAGYQ